MFWRCNYHCIWVQAITFIPNVSHSPYSGMLLQRQSVCVGEYNMDYFATISPKVFVWHSYRILLFFLKKSYSCEKSSKWRNQPSRQVITAYSQKCPLETQDARGCEAYIASAVFLPVLPTDISASHLSPIYLFILCLQEYLSWWQALLPTKLKLKQNQRFSYNK